MCVSVCPDVLYEPTSILRFMSGSKQWLVHLHTWATMAITFVFEGWRHAESMRETYLRGHQTTIKTRKGKYHAAKKIPRGTLLRS